MFLVVFIIVAFCVVVACFVYTVDEAMVGMDFLVAGLVGLMFAVGGIVCIDKLATAPTIPAHLEAKWDIAAAQDNNVTTGHFGLFYGVIDSQARYYYYYVTGPDSYEQGWVSADYATIVEDAPANSGWVEKWGSDAQWKWFSFKNGKTSHYYVHVPKNSVIKQYNFDLKN